MNFLPSDIENIINEYKYQMEHKEKMIKLNEEFKQRYKYNDKQNFMNDIKLNRYITYTPYTIIICNRGRIDRRTIGLVVQDCIYNSIRYKVSIMYDK